MKYSVTTIVKQKVVEKVNEVKEELTKKKQQLIANAGGSPFKKKLAEVTSTQFSNIAWDNKAQKNEQEANKNADIYWIICLVKKNKIW